jgi:hypothetical protein
MQALLDQKMKRLENIYKDDEERKPLIESSKKTIEDAVNKFELHYREKFNRLRTMIDQIEKDMFSTTTEIELEFTVIRNDLENEDTTQESYSFKLESVDLSSIDKLIDLAEKNSSSLKRLKDISNQLCGLQNKVTTL